MRFRIGVWCLGVLAAASLPAAELTLRIEPRWRGVAITVPSGSLATSGGQSVRITRFAGLISQVVLLRPDGSALRLDGQFGAFDAEHGRLTVPLQNVPVGAYAGIEFAIGLPAEINHGDPGRWSAAHALNPLVNGLHWSWQGGYVFLALEGRWSEAAKPLAQADDERGFLFHLATERRQMRLTFRADFQVRHATEVSLAVDVARVLREHRFVAEDPSETTHSAENDPLAATLAANAERAWFWLEARALEPAVAMLGARRETAPTPEFTATPMPFVVPAGFPQPELPADNPLTAEGIALGERLFFDPRLSGTGTQSCASCHAREHAFADSVAVSLGARGTPGVRNSMPLFNLAWSSSYAWDGSQPRIRDQALAAMRNPIEMDADVDKVAAALGRDKELGSAFAAAFGDRTISADRIGLALEQYLLTLVSADSRFDRALRGAEQLSDEEKRGFELFLTEYDPARGKLGADCFHCHGGALLTDFVFRNNGLVAAAADAGRAAATGRESDRAKFKTPSLRNVAITGPYMHDGRFATLEEVVAHYDHGVRRSATLDANLAKHPAAGLRLSAADQRALVAFLRTLTDPAFAAGRAVAGR